MLHLSRKIKLFVLFIFPVIRSSCYFLFLGCFGGVNVFCVFLFNLLLRQEAHSRITSSRYVFQKAHQDVSGPNGRRELVFCLKIYRCFRKWWVSPQIIHFNRVFHCKSSILGYPNFLETSIYEGQESDPPLKLTAFSHPKFSDGWNTSYIVSFLGPGLVSGVNS